MNSYIISEIQNEVEKLNNNGEITNLTYGTQQDRVYNVLNVVFDKNDKHISVVCSFNYILYKLFVTICTNPNTNKVINLSYSDQFLYQTNDLIVKIILNKVFDSIE